ncbi:MAG TPA: hypothetical protein VGM74_11505 [Burkholderiaceae bacterium]|jgi:hypothetical protein
MRIRPGLRLLLLLLAAGCTAFGAAQAQAQSERARIAAERAAANARFADQDRACQQNFVVTSCVDAARKEQRLTLTRLHRAELVLDDAERREAAAHHRQELQERAAAQDARASEPAPAQPSAGARTPAEPNSPATPHGHAAAEPNPAAPRPKGPASSPAERQAEEQRNEQRFTERARAAQEHREAIERRNAKRASEGKVPQPLPMPAAGTAAPRSSASGASAP